MSYHIFHLGQNLVDNKISFLQPLTFAQLIFESHQILGTIGDYDKSAICSKGIVWDHYP